MPSTPQDAKGLLKSAIRDNDPVIFFESKYGYNIEDEVSAEAYTLPLGKADIKRDGKDVTIVALGSMVYKALEAAEDLAADGIDCEVIDPRTILPLDQKTILDSVTKTNRVVIVHEAAKTLPPQPLPAQRVVGGDALVVDGEAAREEEPVEHEDQHEDRGGRPPGTAHQQTCHRGERDHRGEPQDGAAEALASRVCFPREAGDGLFDLVFHGARWSFRGPKPRRRLPGSGPPDQGHR